MSLANTVTTLRPPAKPNSLGTMSQKSIWRGVLSVYHSVIIAGKRVRYYTKGEPITYGSCTVRYVPGTRPVRESYASSDDPVVRNDAKQLSYFARHVRAGDFVLDVGGHIGQYAVLFGGLVGPTGRVVTFEPDSDAHQTLRQNLALNHFQNRVTIEEMALFDSDSEHTFYSRHADSMSSLMRSGLGSNANDAEVRSASVTTMTIDSYLARHGLPSPQFVKLDVEGAEINILRGGSSILKSGTTIVCELHPYAWPEYKTSFEELLQIVRAAGRSIRYLDDAHSIDDGAEYAAVVIS